MVNRYTLTSISIWSVSPEYYKSVSLHIKASLNKHLFRTTGTHHQQIWASCPYTNLSSVGLDSCPRLVCITSQRQCRLSLRLALWLPLLWEKASQDKGGPKRYHLLPLSLLTLSQVKYTILTYRSTQKITFNENAAKAMIASNYDKSTFTMRAQRNPFAICPW